MIRNMDIVKLRKVGTSLVITIPKPLLKCLKWEEGFNLFLEVKEDKLIVRALTS